MQFPKLGRGGGEKSFDSRIILCKANFEELERHAVVWRIFFMENESFIKFDSFGWKKSIEKKWSCRKPMGVKSNLLQLYCFAF